MESNSQNLIYAIENELTFLQCVLNYSRVFEPLFYRGQRICINQLRGTLFDILNHYHGELELDKVRTYELPIEIKKTIEEKRLKINSIYHL